jgi:hypothetical protein
VSEPTSRSPSDRTEPTTDPNDTPLAAALGAFEADGWQGGFAPLEGGDVRCLTCQAELPAADLPTEGLQRLEGAAGPADMAIVVPVTCPRCATRGVLVAQFGPDGGPEDTDVVAAMAAGRGPVP